MEVKAQDYEGPKDIPAEVSSDDDRASNEIYIDPIQEASVLRKFDKILLPQCFIFLLLNYLDRSNLGMFLSIATTMRIY